MSKLILGLVGEFAAGKGTVAKHLREHAGAVSFRFSDPLRDVLGIFDLETSRENMQRVSTVLRENFGENMLAKAIAKRARLSSAELIIVDGVRRFTDIENLRAMPEFKLLHVATEPRIRFERYVKRNENPGDAEMNFGDFMAKHLAEADNQVPEVAKTADVVIENNGSMEELFAKIDEVVSKLSQ